MAQQSLGVIETVGLAAAIDAADAALKSANVALVGYELTRGDGMVAVKIEGEIGAIKAAVDAAAASAARVNTVVSTLVIARPAEFVSGLVSSPDTVGLVSPSDPSNDVSAPAPQSKVPDEPAPVVKAPVQPAAPVAAAPIAKPVEAKAPQDSKAAPTSVKTEPVAPAPVVKAAKPQTPTVTPKPASTPASAAPVTKTSAVPDSKTPRSQSRQGRPSGSRTRGNKPKA